MTPSPAIRHGLPWVVTLVTLMLMFGPGLVMHGRTATDPLKFTDDARHQIAPFLGYRVGGSMAEDYIARYVLDCLPIGYRALYRGFCAVGDPRTLSKILPYVLLLGTATGLAAAGRALAGWRGAWSAVALSLSATAFLEPAVGGLARGFAFPLLAWAAAALAWNRFKWLALVTWLGAVFYPTAAVLTGLTLALHGAWRAWEARHISRPAVLEPLRFVLVTGLVTMALGLPMVLTARPYGTLIRPQEVHAFPEIGPRGRYAASDRPPFDPLWQEATRVLQHDIPMRGDPWWPALHAWLLETPRRSNAVLALGAVVTLLLYGLRCRHDLAARRLGWLVLGAFAAFHIAMAVTPWLYHPTRYVQYAVPVLVVVLLVGALDEAARRLASRRRAVVMIMLTAGLMLATGLRAPQRDLLLNVQIDPQWRLYPYLQSLPPNAVTAGWPAGLMNNVPYVAARPALVTFEMHQAYHRGFTLEMRRRMYALIEAYFAVGAEPLRVLRDEFGVTHLVIDMRHYFEPPSYFAPFQEHVDAAYARMHAAEAAPPLDYPEAVVFQEGAVLVMDLTKLR